MAYRRPMRYTNAQLDAAAKQDLETDFRCALRDREYGYAQTVQVQLDRIAAGERAHLVVLKG